MFRDISGDAIRELVKTQQAIDEMRQYRQAQKTPPPVAMGGQTAQPSAAPASPQGAPPQPNDQQPQGVTCDGLKSELAMLNSAAAAARVDQQLRPKIEARKLYLRQKIAELGCNVNK